MLSSPRFHLIPANRATFPPFPTFPSFPSFPTFPSLSSRLTSSWSLP